MIKIPNLNDPATRMRLSGYVEEIADATPYDDENALPALALALVARAGAAGDPGAALTLVQSALRCYGENMYEERVTVEVREPVERPRRPSARAKRMDALVEANDEWHRTHGDTEAFPGSDFE